MAIDGIKFDKEGMSETGLNISAVSAIMLGSTGNTDKLVLGSECEAYLRNYIMREHQACNLTYNALADGAPMSIPNPITGLPSLCRATLVPQVWRDSVAPVYKRFSGNGPDFYLAFKGLTSRVTHILIPSLDSVIYDQDSKLLPVVWDECQSGEFLENPQKRVGIVDMATNTAHQPMNHLSGIQRLLDTSTHMALDEIWVCGVEFYGSTQDLFPDLPRKIRVMSSKDLASRLQAESAEAFKIGSNIMQSSVRNRIRRMASHRYPYTENMKYYPRIAFTIRTASRRCANLPDVISRVVGGLLPRYPALEVVLDGWAFAESHMVSGSGVMTTLATGHLDNVTAEANMVRQILRLLPEGVPTSSLLGTSVLQSISAIQSIDAYIAHVGTLQHKLGWFTSAKGVVHGPQRQLSWKDSGTFASETGYAPEFIDAAAISDISTDTARGPGSFDYRIDDVEGLISSIHRILSGRGVS